LSSAVSTTLEGFYAFTFRENRRRGTGGRTGATLNAASYGGPHNNRNVNTSSSTIRLAYQFAHCRHAVKFILNIRQVFLQVVL